jgi:formamidopyrimidine-DNA glycosylase
MPELPEVETVRRSLLKRLPGKRITAVKVLRKDSIESPAAADFAKALVGHSFKDITRRGKYILFTLDGGATMVAHLRMSGRLLVVEHGAALNKHVRVCVSLSSNEDLLFEDMRVFGRLWYAPAKVQVEKIVPALAELGVEPLVDLDAPFLKSRFHKRTQAIKTALLDQTVIAGVGNIYADESLHLARINPKKKACSLTAAELERLVTHVKEVLARAIELRGSTLRNYTDSEGVNGNYQNRSWVYGREGEPCRTCGEAIKRIKLAGRSSHFCPQCQAIRQKKV